MLVLSFSFALVRTQYCTPFSCACVCVCASKRCVRVWPQQNDCTSFATLVPGLFYFQCKHGRFFSYSTRFASTFGRRRWIYCFAFSCTVRGYINVCVCMHILVRVGCRLESGMKRERGLICADTGSCLAVRFIYYFSFFLFLVFIFARLVKYVRVRQNVATHVHTLLQLWTKKKHAISRNGWACII